METMSTSESRALPPAADYVRILWLRKWSILLVVVALVGAWLAWSSRRAPVYQATAEVLVKPVGVADKKGDLDMETEKRIAASLGVATIAADKVQTQDPDSLLHGLSVELEGTTPVLSISYSAGNPSEASRRTQALAEAYLEYRRQQVVGDLVATSRAIDQQLRVLRQRLETVNDRISAATSDAARQLLAGEANALSGQVGTLEQQQVASIPPDNLQVGEILKPAAISSAPAPRVREGAIVVLAAIAAGVSQALVREFAEGRLRGAEEVQDLLGAPVLGSLVRRGRHRPGRRRGTTGMATPGDVASSEALRKVRVALSLALERLGARTIVVTGVRDDGAAAPMAANLALAFARSGRHVVLVETDFTSAKTRKLLAVAGATPGLTEVLSSGASLTTALHRTGTANLELLPSGSRPTGVSSRDLLSSDEMKKLLLDLQGAADLVIVQTSPVLASADAVMLAPVVDGIVLVVDSRRDRRTHLQEVQRQLTRVDAKVIGGVLNGA
jgi:capsular exopolysaccharide synthesis family protein